MRPREMGQNQNPYKTWGLDLKWVIQCRIFLEQQWWSNHLGFPEKDFEEVFREIISDTCIEKKNETA